MTLQTVHRHDDEPDAVHAHAHADVWLSDVTAGYGERVALEHVSVTVEPGSLLAVVGPNGAGKSTLLKLMAGLLTPWSGRIEVLAAPAGREARRVAYVPQAENVDWAFPVTVEDVVMMGRFPRLGPVRRPGRDDRRAVVDALAQVGMERHLRTQIGRLSGGQRRRVFLARALAAEPDLFLLDEPVTGIDATTQELLMDLLEAQAKRGKTVVATTHDLACAAQRFQQVLAVNRTVVAYGPSNIVLDADVLASAYGGHLLVLEGRTVILDDAHHHDDAAPGERHFHERDGALMDLILEPLTLGFFVRALVASAMVGLVCAVVGTYVVLRGIAFIGDAIAHASFPGVVAAFLLAVPFYLGAAVAAVGTALAIGYVTKRAGIRQDTAIGVLFAGTFALGVFMFSAIQGYVADLFSFLFGNVLAISPSDLVALVALGLGVLIVIALLWKELLYATFDPLGAAASGIPVDRLEYLFLALVALTIVVSLQAVGIILVVAMLVTPAATAQMLTVRFTRLMAVAAIVGISSAVLGLYLSYWLDVASGATIVLVQTGLFLVAMVFGPRGMLARRRAVGVALEAVA